MDSNRDLGTLVAYENVAMANCFPETNMLAAVTNFSGIVGIKKYNATMHLQGLFKK